MNDIKRINISEMTVDTAREVAELEALCFGDPWPYQSFINTLSNDHAQYYTLTYYDTEDNRYFVGYIGMYDLIDEVSVINVAVHPDFRGNGAGVMLMERAEEYAMGRGCPAITLEVRESNRPARALYERMGYTPYAVTKKYYSNPTEDAVLYRKGM